jgi:hypothetical protein
MLLDAYLPNEEHQAATLRTSTGPGLRHFRYLPYSEAARPYKAFLRIQLGKCAMAKYPQSLKTRVWPMLPAPDCMLASRYEVAELTGHAAGGTSEANGRGSFGSAIRVTPDIHKSASQVRG